MKKSRIAGFLLLCPAVLLCSCSSAPTLTLTANWYKNTQITTVGDTLETLEYEVTFKAYETNTGFQVEYDKGTYTTELKNDLLTLSDGTTKEGYVYTTRLDITGRFTLNGETSETFADYINSTVRFLPVGDKLQPVASLKEVHTTSPLSERPLTLSSAFATFHYTYGVDYDADLSNATIRYCNLLATEKDETVTELKIQSDYTFLDNEEILFALRGLDYSVSNTFRTINPVNNNVHTVNLSAASATVLAQFNMDGKDVREENLAAFAVSVSYDTTYSGQTQKITLAAKTDASNNTYRNVVLSMEVPILQSLGNLTYQLVKAEFSNKS